MTCVSTQSKHQTSRTCCTRVLPRNQRTLANVQGLQPYTAPDAVDTD